MKECQAALRVPTSQWNPRAEMKAGFKSSRDELRRDLIAMLQEVVNLNDIAAQKVKLITKVATMWLDFGLQRYRLLMTNNCTRIKYDVNGR